MRIDNKSAHSHKTILTFILLLFLTHNTVNAIGFDDVTMYIADYISSTPFISERDLILLSTHPRTALRWHQRRILKEYGTQIQNYYHDNYLAQLATFNSRKSELEIWNDIPAVAEFVTEQIMTLETTCYLELDLQPGLYSAKELLTTIHRAYIQLRTDLFVWKPPKYVFASRKLEAFVLLNANILAWLNSKPDIITKTILTSPESPS